MSFYCKVIVQNVLYKVMTQTLIEPMLHICEALHLYTHMHTHRVRCNYCHCTSDTGSLMIYYVIYFIMCRAYV